MEDSFYGVWGNMREKYLREKNPKLYAAMLEKGELEEYLTSYQKSYSQRAEKIFERRNSKIGKKRIGLKRRRAKTDFLLEIK